MKKEITYAQTVDKRPFNWNRFLKSKTHNEAAWDKAIQLATHWTTCACGTQCAIIPRSAGGEPDNKALSKLGMRFMDAITAKNTTKAKVILVKIEQHSAILIKRIKDKAKKVKKAESKKRK